MSGHWLLAALLPVGALVVAAPGGRAQAPAETPANPENIAAALRLTVASAAEYEFRVGDEKPLDLQREPVLKWSNPDRGEVHGNVFVWTRDGRPLAVGSLFKWFSPDKHMSHEFQSLAEGPLAAKFHGKPVWKTSEPGVRFVDLPGAPAPAPNDAQRLLQMKQLAREFSGIKKESDGTGEVELRLLPQPIHRYAAPKEGIVTGGLFTLVHGTDPEMLVLIEARGKDAARWQYAVTRMTWAALRLRHRDTEVWSVDALSAQDAHDHARPYTTFYFRDVPDFLKDALVKPKK